MEICITYKVLHRFFVLVLDQRIEYENFIDKFQRDREFRYKLIKQFEAFFFDLAKAAAVYEVTDNIVLSSNNHITLEKSSRKGSFILANLYRGEYEPFVSKAQLSKKIKGDMFSKGLVTFFYPTDKGYFGYKE